MGAVQILIIIIIIIISIIIIIIVIIIIILLLLKGEERQIYIPYKESLTLELVLLYYTNFLDVGKKFVEIISMRTLFRNTSVEDYFILS